MVTHSAQCTRQLSRQCVTVPLAHGAAGTLEYCSGIRPCHVKTDLGRRRILCKESFLRCQIFLACCDSGLARHMISRRPIARQVRRVFSSYSSQWHRWGLCLQKSLLPYVRGCSLFPVHIKKQSLYSGPFPGSYPAAYNKDLIQDGPLVLCTGHMRSLHYYLSSVKFWPTCFLIPF